MTRGHSGSRRLRPTSWADPRDEDRSVPPDLPRRLGTLDAAALFVGIILGSGIFVAPATVAAALPGPAGALLWVAGGVVAACGAFCYAECAARLPRTGGFYAFYREAYGAPVAFIGGWAGLLVTYPASMAAISLVCAQYMGELVPGLAGRPALVAAAALLGTGALNLFGVRLGAWSQRILTSTKAGALSLVGIAALVAGSAGPQRAAPGAASPAGAAGLLGAMVVLLWTYDGWSDVTLVAGEVRRPGRDLGRAVALGCVALVGIYVLVQIAVATLLPPAAAASSGRVVADAVESGLGPVGSRLVAWLVVVSTFGSVHGTSFTASRLGFAMARDGSFFRALGAVDPRWGTPARGIAALTAAALVYVAVAEFRGLLAFFSFSVWIFYGLTAAALLLLRRRRVGEPVSWRAPGGALAPAVILATAAGMTFGLASASPRNAAIGLGILACGIPVYALWSAAGRRW